MEVNISNFINNLPFGRDTSSFTMKDVLRFISQATNIIEAIEMGATCFFIDKDICATNFMIRDEKMMKLVVKNKEPIIPFVQKVNLSC